MKSTHPRPALDLDFRPQATLWIALGALLLITPFAGLHFAERRTGLGIVSIGVVLVLGLNAWYLCARGPRAALAPRVIFAGLGIALDLYLLVTRGTSGLLWGYPTVLWLHCTLPERPAQAANAVLLIVTLPLLPLVAAPDVALRAIVTLVAVSLFSCVLVHVISRQQERLKRELLRDPLTRLLNRHVLDETLAQAIARARRDGTPATLLALDLDHFKRINDELGHLAGDDVLRALGTLLRARLRASDTAFRIGGEEFLVLLHDTGAEDARWLAEALLAEIREASLLPGRTITASVGIAPLEDERDPREWSARADEALYRAKRAGRDRAAARLGPVATTPRPDAGSRQRRLAGTPAL